MEDRDRNLEIASASWHTLRPHLERDAVIVVSAKHDLKQVAECIAEDNTELVQKWINEESVSKPTLQQIELWNNDLTTEFECAIVQPFVLMKLNE